MFSTRARITAAFAGLLLATMLAFALVLYLARRTEARDELQQVAHTQGDRVLDALVSAHADGRPLAVVSANPVTGPPTQATPEMVNLLGQLPGYFLVTDPQGRLLYSSMALRLLKRINQDTLYIVGLQLNSEIAAVVPLSNQGFIHDMLVVSVSDTAVGPGIERVISAVPTNFADLSLTLLLWTLLLIVPLVVIISLLAAYLLAGRAFKPVDLMITEVEAIADGRSLHRRLPTDAPDDELGRLAETLNRMIARLQTSFGALRRFTADASHELKTPLTVLRADIERATHPGTPDAERSVALEEALHEISRMADLVDSLLTLARADEGRFDLHRIPVQMAPVVREVLETATILGEEAGISVSLPLEEDAVVLGDPARLRQLMLNLITNAIKYTGRGGRVEMTLSHRNNNAVAFAVRDTGVGISAADLPHVFERFWRADRVRSRAAERGGFGLGLAIAQWIVQAHGGTLTVQSRLGRGTVMTVLLPMLSENGPAPDIGTAEPQEG